MSTKSSLIISMTGQQTGADVQRCRKFTYSKRTSTSETNQVNTAEESGLTKSRPSALDQTVIGPDSPNDQDIFSEEFIESIARCIVTHFQDTKLPRVENLYAQPFEVNTKHIEEMLIEGIDCNQTLRNDVEPCEEDISDSEMDSGMDETIRPATYTPLQYRHCSSAKGSQEPRRFSPGYSPIRFCGTPAKDGAETILHSPAPKKRFALCGDKF